MNEPVHNNQCIFITHSAVKRLNINDVVESVTDIANHLFAVAPNGAQPPEVIATLDILLVSEDRDGEKFMVVRDSAQARTVVCLC